MYKCRECSNAGKLRKHQEALFGKLLPSREYLIELGGGEGKRECVRDGGRRVRSLGVALEKVYCGFFFLMHASDASVIFQARSFAQRARRHCSYLF